MFVPQYYPTSPPGCMPYNYRTPPLSPSPNGSHGYYSPRYSVHTPSPRGSPKVQPQRASQEANGYAHFTPRVASYFAQTAYSSPGYYGSARITPQRKADYVSLSDRIRSKIQRFRVPADGSQRRSASKRYTSHSHHVYVDVFADDGHLPSYDAPPPYEHCQSYREAEAEADHYAYDDQIPVYTEAQPTPSKHHHRRTSYTTRTRPPPSRAKPSAAKSPPKATDDDARRAGIPAGFSFKNWDPTEEPILLLGSVFDANSLGKWIYDWTVFHCGPATPMTDVAGELWLLLIQLAGKVKRAEECMPRIRRQESRELVDDFLESGERLWQRFNGLLKICEDYMWKAAKKESGGKKNVTMGKNSGCEFVDSIFGRERELQRTEKLMTGMRLWSMRFDANCEDILRHPSA
ncbi:hypothetical protein LTR16_002965 [Cryomyces antarcticus]|uniref:Vegetative cell wall protein gp1 n=1 Tax=Cryomyces antarcticus TaxID=329879 RepID=A0ABR0M732_9PEZI|nr:hypothetical protein LTR16_002965 [Cryomyces antarcticus]